MQLSIEQQKFMKQANSYGFNLYMFMKLPAAFFAGVRMKHFNEKECAVSVPYKWLSQNPFKSTYFACLAMAAEMSTGVPALMAIFKQSPSVSMLVVKLEGTFSKKADDLSTFVCKDVQAIMDVVEQCKKDTDGRTFLSESIGYNKMGQEVARFHITWSFKQKSA